MAASSGTNGSERFLRRRVVLTIFVVLLVCDNNVCPNLYPFIFYSLSVEDNAEGGRSNGERVNDGGTKERSSGIFRKQLALELGGVLFIGNFQETTGARTGWGAVARSFFKSIDSTFRQHVSSGQPVIDTPPPIFDAIPPNFGAPPISDAIPPNSPESSILANTQADRELNKDWMLDVISFLAYVIGIVNSHKTNAIFVSAWSSFNLNILVVKLYFKYCYSAGDERFKPFAPSDLDLSDYSNLFVPDLVHAFDLVVVAEGYDRTNLLWWVHAWTLTHPHGLITQVHGLSISILPSPSLASGLHPLRRSIATASPPPHSRKLFLWITVKAFRGASCVISPSLSYTIDLQKQKGEERSKSKCFWAWVRTGSAFKRPSGS
ncbi:wound-induced protein 1-like [Senna tora]|uniref:Wound-induced protein 1-like n=1 Tax=Senna tora TaxID=362788 RepID=A0A834SEH3_9FABA|nr:wound-induced protein 1-like [Senna tora]